MLTEIQKKDNWKITTTVSRFSCPHRDRGGQYLCLMTDKLCLKKYCPIKSGDD